MTSVFNDPHYADSFRTGPLDQDLIELALHDLKVAKKLLKAGKLSNIMVFYDVVGTPEIQGRCTYGSLHFLQRSLELISLVSGAPLKKMQRIVSAAITNPTKA